MKKMIFINDSICKNIGYGESINDRNLGEYFFVCVSNGFYAFGKIINIPNYLNYAFQIFLTKFSNGVWMQTEIFLQTSINAFKKQLRTI